MSKRATPADYGLVALVGGGAALLLIGMATIGVSAFLGRIPVPLAALLAIAAVVTLIGLAMTIATRGSGDD